MYVDAIKKGDIIKVVERRDGERYWIDYPIKYTMYYDDPNGKYKSMYGKNVSRIVCHSSEDFHKQVKSRTKLKLYETDINPINQCLSENYSDEYTPKLHVCFFDIEVDFHQTRGFADPSDPFMPITAITLYLQWLDLLITLSIPPKTLTVDEARNLVSDFSNTLVFEREADMLNTFLEMIDDVDVFSGWNSETYDIPYIVNRIRMVLGPKHIKRLCLWDQNPRKREYEAYGKMQQTYDLAGRVHLDSLALYRKFTYDERHSYRLDAIGEIEVGETKTVYDGTLDQLYNNDFKKFIEYNRQDVALLNKIDRKLRFMDLANELAHSNTVLLPLALGTVGIVEQAIINEAHERQMIVPQRVRSIEEIPAPGAYVAYPVKGLHKWIGTMDINSLYPSLIRALNMSPETIVGQIQIDETNKYILEQVKKHKKTFAEAWENIFNVFEYDYVMEQREDKTVVIKWENGTSNSMTGKQAYDIVHDNDLVISANGTLFRTDIEGIIPGLLKKWYQEPDRTTKQIEIMAKFRHRWNRHS